MVEGKKKSRSLKRIKRKTPGKKTVTHYRRKTPNVAKCAKCGNELKGIPRLRSAKLKNTTKSQKSVARPYGGNLCSKCMRTVIKEKHQ